MDEEEKAALDEVIVATKRRVVNRGLGAIEERMAVAHAAWAFVGEREAEAARNLAKEKKLEVERARNEKDTEEEGEEEEEEEEERIDDTANRDNAAAEAALLSGASETEAAELAGISRGTSIELNHGDMFSMVESAVETMMSFERCLGEQAIGRSVGAVVAALGCDVDSAMSAARKEVKFGFEPPVLVDTGQIKRYSEELQRTVGFATGAYILMSGGTELEAAVGAATAAQNEGA